MSSFNWRSWAETNNLKYEYDKTNGRGLIYFSWVDPVKLCYMEVNENVLEATLNSMLLHIKMITDSFALIDALQNKKWKCQGHLKICLL